MRRRACLRDKGRNATVSSLRVREIQRAAKGRREREAKGRRGREES